MRPDRRSLLLTGLGAGGLAAIGGLSAVSDLAWATTGTDRYTIFCYFRGGWDILLGLDPRDPLVFRDDRRGETRIQPGYELLDDPPTADVVETSVPEMQLGPYIGNLAAWADRMAVVRGMSMETLTHEAGRRRFLTGKPPSGVVARGTSAGTVLASYLGTGEPIPQLSAAVEAYNDGFPTWASALKVSSVSDLVAALRPGVSVPGELEQAQIAALLEYVRTCPSHLGSQARTEAHAFRQAARDLVGQELDSLFDFGAGTPQMSALRSTWGFTPNQLNTVPAQAAMAVQAITSGVSRVVSIAVTQNLDTHGNEWTTDHGPDLMGGFDAVAKMAQELDSRAHPAGGTWLDRTTIVGFSEFSRTALLNANGGRDHSLTNACFLLGGNVAGGRVIGASSDQGMSPTPTDLITGAPSATGEVIRPEHVLRALLVDAGIPDDVSDLRVDPLAALFA